MTIDPEVAKCFFICVAVILTTWAVAFGSRRRRPNKPRSWRDAVADDDTRGVDSPEKWGKGMYPGKKGAKHAEQ